MSDPWDNPSAYEGQVTSGFSEQARRAEFPMSPTPNPQEIVAKLLDLADMPRYNPITNTTGRSDRDVSKGKVYLHPTWKVACLEHGAMNCVNEQRTIWRCLTCGRGAYAPEPLVAEPHVVQVPQESSPGFEEVLKDLSDHECTGLRCPHETADTHYLIFDADLEALRAAHQKEIQAAKREAYNDVWQGFKQQYTGTKWEQEMEPWLRSFVAMANITSKHLGESE